VDKIWQFDLEGKVAVVTGGSRGIGAAICRGLAGCGADLLIASRKQAACEQLAAELSALYGTRCIGVGCHVGHWDACDELIARVLKEFGHIDVLVNNAGMSPIYDSLDAVSEALYDKVHAVNARGPFRLSSLAGAQMMATKAGGSIINISSIAAVQPTPGELPYAVAKAGLNTMTIGLARAFGPKVRVNCIMPGPFLTDISKAWDLQAFAARAAETIPLQRGGQPEEVVGAVLYLASELSSYTTGAVIKIDGGSAFAPA
jgi:NAD(P)-dependent dehydrogenase (short-subunit alcohol dehydrogenase family)